MPAPGSVAVIHRSSSFDPWFNEEEPVGWSSLYVSEVCLYLNTHFVLVVHVDRTVKIYFNFRTYLQLCTYLRCSQHWQRKRFTILSALIISRNHSLPTSVNRVFLKAFDGSGISCLLATQIHDNVSMHSKDTWQKSSSFTVRKTVFIPKGCLLSFNKDI